MWYVVVRFVTFGFGHADLWNRLVRRYWLMGGCLSICSRI